MTILHALWRRNPALAAFGVAMLILTPLLALGMIVDPRDFNGAPLWLKPTKFALSQGIYLVSLAWIFGYVRPTFRRSLTATGVAWVVILAALFEQGYVTWRAFQGEASHFNFTTSTTTGLYFLMGIAAMAMTAASVALAFGVARGDQPIGAAYRVAVVLGLVLGFVLGAGVGGLLGGMGSHWIGGERSDLHGLWGFEWSTTGGDLRIAHFFGLHALQILPIFGLLVNRLDRRVGVISVVAFSVAYAALVVWLVSKALAGQPPWLV